MGLGCACTVDLDLRDVVGDRQHGDRPQQFSALDPCLVSCGFGGLSQADGLSKGTPVAAMRPGRQHIGVEAHDLHNQPRGL
jgi:hypothetical protein